MYKICYSWKVSLCETSLWLSRLISVVQRSLDHSFISFCVQFNISWLISPDLLRWPSLYMTISFPSTLMEVLRYLGGPITFTTLRPCPPYLPTQYPGLAHYWALVESPQIPSQDPHHPEKVFWPHYAHLRRIFAYSSSPSSGPRTSDEHLGQVAPKCMLEDWGYEMDRVSCLYFIDVFHGIASVARACWTRLHDWIDCGIVYDLINEYVDKLESAQS